MSGVICQEGFDKTLAVSIGTMSKEVRACMSFTLLFSSLGVYLRGLILFSLESVSLTAEKNRNKDQKCHLLWKQRSICVHRCTCMGTQGSSPVSESLEGDYCCRWYFLLLNMFQKNTRGNLVYLLRLTRHRWANGRHNTQVSTAPFCWPCRCDGGGKPQLALRLAETLERTRSLPDSITAALGKGNGGSKWCSPGSPFRHSNVLGPQNKSELFWTEVQTKDIPQGTEAKPHPSCYPGALG